MHRFVLGIDCAVRPANVGFALAELGAGMRILDVRGGSAKSDPVRVAADMIGARSPVLLALDAPLGWPAPVSQALANHQAGAPLHATANQLFRRHTDGFVERELGKRPLDVGADRIARTAVAALEFLHGLRAHLDQEIPLAWTPGQAGGIEAIEVYPAATLKAHGLIASGYKGEERQIARAGLVLQLAERIEMSTQTMQLLEASDHALDAVVCCLAGCDFWCGDVHSPEDVDLARREGWIWVRKNG